MLGSPAICVMSQDYHDTPISGRSGMREGGKLGGVAGREIGEMKPMCLLPGTEAGLASCMVAS